MNKPTEKTTEEKIISAHQRAAHWLAEANAAEEAGNLIKANRLIEKAQYWLDRLNELEGMS